MLIQCYPGKEIGCDDRLTHQLFQYLIDKSEEFGKLVDTVVLRMSTSKSDSNIVKMMKIIMETPFYTRRWEEITIEKRCTGKPRKDDSKWSGRCFKLTHLAVGDPAFSAQHYYWEHRNIRE